MATYKFRKPDGEEFEIEMSVHDLDDYKKSHPDYKQLIYSLNYTADPCLKNKVPDGFRSVLRNIKDSFYKSTIDVP